MSNTSLPVAGTRAAGRTGTADLQAALQTAEARARHWLFDQQHADGFWCGELEGDTILESEYILLLAWLGRERDDVALRAARYILRQQQAHGGWSLFPGGGLDISGSVKAYLALKLAGMDPESAPMQKARTAIREHGGADAVNSFTRFYLALLGQISYAECPAVPPEMVLLPNWSPINIYRISAWSRTIFVPLSVMWAFRPQRQLDQSQGIRELFLREPQEWPPLNCPGQPRQAGWCSWAQIFLRLDACLKWCEQRRIHPFRRRALRVAEKWMLDRFEGSDGLGAIFPPIIWSLVALKCLGYGDESQEVAYCHRQLEELMVFEQDTVRLQPCKSPVWDTALTLRALASSQPDEVTAGQQRAVDWLLSKEVRCLGDWSVNCRQPQAGGWFFEHQNVFYPDVDDTIMVMMALAETDDGLMSNDAPIREPCRRGLEWLLQMQNRDGGWGAFDKNNDLQLLCHVPFADHNAMIDPSTPDITARVLECLAQFGLGVGDPCVDGAVDFLRRTQESDGSWFGRWGVNYIYGTWQVLAGLSALGLPPSDPALSRGADWLIDRQQSSGGWGESAESYVDPGHRSQVATASQTAWAVWGLIAAGRRDHPSTIRGVRYLLDAQTSAGIWHETDFTGTGFPLVFYLRYHLYPVYFPLLALAKWRTHAENFAPTS